MGGGMPDKSHALASSDDTIKPYVAFNMLYDNNLLRLSDTVDPVSITGKSDKSDFIKQLAAGLDMDWTLSRQHIIVKALINQNWFQNFSALDYLGWDTRAQWNWQLGNHWDGEIGYSNSQTLGSFGQLNSLVGNLQNNQRSFVNAGYLFHPNGKIKFGLFRTEYQLVDKARKVSNNIEDNAEIDLQYLSPTGSVLGFRLVATDGQYPDRGFTAGDTQDNAYTRMNYALTWDWKAGDKTRVEGNLGYTEQHFEHLGERDFSGITARLGLRWQASDKTRLELTAKREIDQAQNLFSSFLITQGVWFNLNWQAGPKITVTVPMSYQEQKYLGSVDTAGSPQQKDKVGNIGLDLSYHPVENISIGAVLNYEKRDSNDPLRSYEITSIGINLRAVF
jgi:exopolysaccharide biosynthesis operon protein EpsL